MQYIGRHVFLVGGTRKSDFSRMPRLLIQSNRKNGQLLKPVNSQSNQIFLRKMKKN